MKRVGICACYDTRNYGSMLQSLATQIVIDEMGYESEFIVYRKKKNLKYIISQIPRLFNKNLMSDKLLGIKKKIILVFHPNVKEKLTTRENAFKNFQNTFYRRFSNVYCGYEELKKSACNYSSVVVGSDQLWTPGGLATNFYNLMFVPDNINKVSYATSFGVSRIPFYQRKKTREYLCRIDHLSVREKKGAHIVREIADVEAKVVADPTLLLTREEWDQIIPNKREIKEPYIFCYFLGKNKRHRELAEELKKMTGLKVVSIPFLDSYVGYDKYFGDEQLYEIGPNGFVNMIRHAEYILTDSFHGTVFSVIYEKKIVVFNRYSNDSVNSRNSRIDSLCEILGIENRRYHGGIYSTITENIDYQSVSKKVNSFRLCSKQFLENALKTEG